MSVEGLKRELSKHMSTKNTADYGLTEDQLDELLAEPGGLPASTLQQFNASTLER